MTNYRSDCIEFFLTGSFRKYPKKKFPPRPVLRPLIFFLEKCFWKGTQFCTELSNGILCITTGRGEGGFKQFSVPQDHPGTAYFEFPEESGVAHVAEIGEERDDDRQHVFCIADVTWGDETAPAGSSTTRSSTRQATAAGSSSGGLHRMIVWETAGDLKSKFKRWQKRSSRSNNSSSPYAHSPSMAFSVPLLFFDPCTDTRKLTRNTVQQQHSLSIHKTVSAK